uniref:Acyltransferase n=1 Tax=Syphacia muris TaxID=451379 RepID=A0A0N5AI68_9BILA
TSSNVSCRLSRGNSAFFLRSLPTATPAVLQSNFLFTSLRWLLLLYFIWFYYDFRTPRRGGYSKSIVKWWRTQRLHKYFSAYFPSYLHKTAELLTGKNYLLVCHPHGIFPFGVYTCFATGGTGIYEKFPEIDIRVATLSMQFLVAVRREWMLFHGTVDCSKESLHYLLDTSKHVNNAVVLVVGGAAEALDSHPGSHVLTLKERKGFVKIALETGAQLVPVYSFGETELYEQVKNPRGSRLRAVQDTLKKILGFSLPIFNGRGIFNYNFGLLPRRRQIDVVVGSPVEVKRNPNPTQDEIEQLHTKYIEALEELFDANKVKYGIPKDEKLVLV